MKKKLSQAQQFEILKLVLDKFLWLGLAVMAFGLYEIFTKTAATGFVWIVIGAVILLIFVIIIMREYELTTSDEKPAPKAKSR